MINFYCLSYKTNNLGDSLTKVFFDFISKNHILLTKDQTYPHYITIGSILGKANSNSILMGCGAMCSNTLCVIPKQILWVRGPLTRQVLLNINIDCPEKYGDPLILFPLVYSIQKDIVYDIGIIPHSSDKKSVKKDILKNKLMENYKVLEIDINVRQKKYYDIDYEFFINELLSCNIIIASSLHAVIFAIIYGKKVIYTEFDHQSEFKFIDFFESIKIKYLKCNYDDDNLLDNIIKVDYNEVLKIGISMIELIPFIDDDRKNELSQNWYDYYKNTFNL
jgi:pyruvyltransferase